MDEKSTRNITGRRRSSTFGVYESAIREVNCLSQTQNLIVSPMRSVVSGVGLSSCGRRRSESWHGSAVQTRQVQEEVIASPASLTKPHSEAATNLRNIFQEIITGELHAHLGDAGDLKCSQEFIDKSAVISKAIGEKARKVIDRNAKIIASVFIGEVRGDGIEVASQCLLDPAQDIFVFENFKTSDIFAVGTLFVTSYTPRISS